MKRARFVVKCAALWSAGIFAVACGGASIRPGAKPEMARAGSAKEVSSAQVGTTVQDTTPKDTMSDEVKALFARAVATYNAQRKSGQLDYKALIRAFEAVLDEDDDMAEAHYNLGCIYEAQREDDDARKHYETALKLKPELTVAAASLGGLLSRQGKLDEALALYQRALSKDAKNSAVLLSMASIYQNQKKFSEALKSASDVLVRDPTNIGAYRVMASAYYAMGKMEMAQLIAMRGLLVGNNDPILLNTLGLVLLELKKSSEALVQFREAVAVQPDMLPTRFNIAKIALDYRDFRVAREQFEKILEYEPNNKQAAIGMAIAARGTGDLEAARTQFRALTSKYPKDPTAYQWLCRLALRNFNSPADAKTECNRCINAFNERPPDNHPCVVMYNESVQGIEMDKKMKEVEAQALEEQRKLDEKLKALADLRKRTIDEAFERAQKACDVVPPKKLEGAELEFVLDPLAVTPDKQTTVKLLGALFGELKVITVGTIKVKHRVVDESTLEITVPKGLEEGPWDILITRKDGSELFFGGGLWVGKKPTKCGAATEAEGAKETKESGEAQENANKTD